MVYKLMGLPIPKPIREKLAKGGADFSDYFPVRNNTKPTNTVMKGSLGFITDATPATDEELKEPPKKSKKVEDKFDWKKKAEELEK